MKTVILLCGSHNVGKTKTLKTFFGVHHISKLKSMQLLDRVLDGKNVYASSLSSPQELAKDFCNVEKVKNQIDKRLKKCDKKSLGEDYILIIPFTMSVKDGKINDNCILEPIDWLKSMNIKVFPVYLRKTKADLLDSKDDLMKKISATIIESRKDEEYRQAKELENIIKKL